ncbi:prepilin-type N-terminal cleavage/methylation domain-containing protein [Oribacterium sp. WCC10]|uniref:prepilin-type N-terminal cleavage/methylation domain-containing protein n=1 Tax=Oribacterium sp. WCC10 TaxID=1855343 RepID=UPI0008F2997E|nr:prepilin-type N-terminal cleavage/methylation domain-containing protein [Oribacterium sp. WCC10]SFG30075.1 prepilin-type N-terminal cleavage/methylation domain-containing protein [Oribacterium sp. WCC10]
MKGRHKKGFTLAELLIIVAIIGVLVAISIPIFQKNLEKSRETVDIHTMRAAASLGQQFYYEGVTGKQSALKAGMQWYTASGGDGADGSNAFAIYIADKGVFSKYNYDGSIDDGLKPYGKGASLDGGVVLYGINGELAYNPKLDYRKAVCQVSIFPNGPQKRVEVAWKVLQTGNTRPFIGGNNPPKLTYYLN